MTGIQALQDKQEITELCYRYGLTLDSRDWAGLASVFTPDANAFYLDLPPCHGYQAIEDTCRTALEPMSATQHLISNVVVRLDGDQAESSCYLQAQHVKAGTPGGDNLIIAGRYDDRLIRTPDGWRIRERRLALIWTSGNPAVAGDLLEHTFDNTPLFAVSMVYCSYRVFQFYSERTVVHASGPVPPSGPGDAEAAGFPLDEDDPGPGAEPVHHPAGRPRPRRRVRRDGR